jgi:hypothetical protein
MSLGVVKQFQGAQSAQGLLRQTKSIGERRIAIGKTAVSGPDAKPLLEMIERNVCWRTILGRGVRALH